MYKNTKRRKRFNLFRPLRWIVSLFVWLWILSALIVLLLRFVPPPTTSFMIQTAFRNGFYDYRWQPYEQISSNMAIAAIAAEDQRFPIHSGFDVEAINAAIRDAEGGASLRGASTITQQVAKNLFLWPGGGFVRKGIEAGLTTLIELMWNKQRILEVYLNIAQFSDRTFGVEAASQQFFQISARDLTAEEAALLAAVLPGPELYSLESPSWEVLDRQGWILIQMSQLGGEAYLQQLYDGS
ncbi:monofunctional biosynthetic peptidoglycan transglycosylase [cf. Phormidesmis sp. LEGE 11477]|uniref:monofunctional biosynthetic peptidoglycan transglycosylase n=1 Tax=cf. Phormidesmis sp. LEGE 11477 TaxID=1828680 RepID=UPI0018819797|nr:monofunctional biosynthetic peptidoglycan transglycosylase [cf. Phormidesmis sp. LEGE 11477]MBE9062623.1 monofunctional biosynthetic peptidoglycan transglycosylase [cf. Phormidesmis sp. LEGE 11477]